MSKPSFTLYPTETRMMPWKYCRGQKSILKYFGAVDISLTELATGNLYE